MYNKLIEYNDNEDENWIVYFKTDDITLEGIQILSQYLPNHKFYNNQIDLESVEFILNELEGLGNYMPLASMRSISDNTAESIFTLAEFISNIDEGDDQFDMAYDDIQQLFFKCGIFS